MVVLGGSIAQWLTFGIENDGVFYTFVYAGTWPKPVHPAPLRRQPTPRLAVGLRRCRRPLATSPAVQQVPIRLNFPARQ